MKLGYILTLVMMTISSVQAETIDNKIQQLLNQHYNEYKTKEYFSGGALSFLIPNDTIKNYYVGTVSHLKNSEKISARTLFQIGSITKSFTATLILQAENDGKLHLSDTLKQWMPKYIHWSSISIEQLLNMTSGIPNYSNTPIWNTIEGTDLQKVWLPTELINLVYLPKYDIPLMKGYYYTNTGYLLLSQIVEKATKTNFNKLVTDLIHKANLKNTVYPIPTMDQRTQSRIASGYNYNQYDNPELVGSDLRFNNLSWAGSAGALVSNTEDIIKWVQALFRGEILTLQQKQKLLLSRSILTGEIVDVPTKTNPNGFGLGVAHAYRDSIGDFWYYEGKTLGFRALYIYVPCNQIIIATVFNSAPSGQNDAIHKLVQNVYNLLLTDNPKLICKK